MWVSKYDPIFINKQTIGIHLLRNETERKETKNVNGDYHSVMRL